MWRNTSPIITLDFEEVRLPDQTEITSHLFFQHSCLAFFYSCAQFVEICFLVVRKYNSQLWRNIPNSAHFAPSAAHSCVYFNFLCSHKKKLCLWERCELKDTHYNQEEIHFSVKKYTSYKNRKVNLGLVRCILDNLRQRRFT